MTTIPTYLKGHKAVIAAYGYWPSFHDSPVVSFSYSPEPLAEIVLCLHAWEMTPEVDSRGFYILRKHHRVSFRFSGVCEPALDQFTEDNILFGLPLSTEAEFQAQGKFKVELSSAMGSDRCGEFWATAGEVFEVSSCDTEGRSI